MLVLASGCRKTSRGVRTPVGLRVSVRVRVSASVRVRVRVSVSVSVSVRVRVSKDIEGRQDAGIGLRSGSGLG